MFTSSFKEDMDILTPPEDKTYDESSNMVCCNVLNCYTTYCYT